MCVYFIVLVLLVRQSPMPESALLPMPLLILSTLSLDSPPTLPRSFAIAYTCEKLGGLEREPK